MRIGITLFFRKHCLFLSALAFILPGQISGQTPSPAQENPYIGITKFSDDDSIYDLWSQYRDRNLSSKRYFSYFPETSEFINFLSQFVDLEELDLFSCFGISDIDLFLQHPPSLPKLKSLSLPKELSRDINWLRSYAQLETLSILNPESIDLSPLTHMSHLSKLHISSWLDDASIFHVGLLPPSLKVLNLYGCKMEISELNHLRLKELGLGSRRITQLPQKESLVELEVLDISSTSIQDLSSLQDNQSLKVFEYSSAPTNVNFEVVNTFSNLEEIRLREFPDDQEKLEAAIGGLSKLQHLLISGRNIRDLSFLTCTNLSFLATEGRLLITVPISILSSPSLTRIWTSELNRSDCNFVCENLPPNLREFEFGYNEYCDFSKLSRLPLEILNCTGVTTIENGADLIALAPTLTELSAPISVIQAVIDAHGEEALEAFTNLKSLEFSLNNTESILFLKRFPSLEVLDIDDAEDLTPADLDIFLEMKSLKSIEIWDTSEEVSMRMEELRKQGVPFE